MMVTVEQIINHISTMMNIGQMAMMSEPTPPVSEDDFPAFEDE